MKELPILFSAPMVRAILEGRKTVTRRVVKLPHQNPLGKWEPTTFGGTDAHGVEHDEQVAIWHTRTGDTLGCPYGQPGDRLWVRETFALEHCVEHDQEPPFTDGRPVRRRDEPGEARWVQPHYRATDSVPELRYEFGCSASCPENDPHVHWKPSIHMPRWASRITLEVTGVRVERLQDISEDHALAEGIRELPLQEREPGAWWCADPLGNSSLHCRTPRAAFSRLWESINGPNSWNANPWVWVVEFKRVTS